jgi:hypothetical protein
MKAPWQRETCPDDRTRRDSDRKTTVSVIPLR